MLDNCEHLVDAAAHLANELLISCPRLRILATSREPLGIPGETVWPVPTLSLPGPDSEITVQDLIGAEAARLFMDRVRSRIPGFELTPDNAGAVAMVCRKLDGIPLAIELSAARMAALAVEQLAERLDDSLGLLTGGGRTAAPRHQTMRATLNWSHDLMDRAERTLFRQLSVFTGGWTLEAAEALGTLEESEMNTIVDLLSRLVNKSMVVVEEAGTSTTSLRYGMLEPVRQYGWERLQASGEDDEVQRRHASWFFELAKEVEPWSRGAHQVAWLDLLEKEYGNLRAALDWALEKGEADLGLWFGGALGEFWYMSGNLAEGRRWLEAALSKSADSPPTIARALVRAGWISWEQGDYQNSIAMGEESLTLSRNLSDEAGIVAALTNLGWAKLLSGNVEESLIPAGEAIALGRRVQDSGGVARALLIPGLAAIVEGDHKRALTLHEESLQLAREAEDTLAMDLSLVMGAFASLGLGDIQRAEALCAENLAHRSQPRVMNATAFQFHASAALACSQGSPERSAMLWGAAESLRETIGAALAPVEVRVYSPYIEAVRQALGQEAWETAWAEGKKLTVEEAENILVESKPLGLVSQPRISVVKDVSADRRSEVILTGRQREIALLVARGLTNRQIASELAIAENTVANHVARIARKLEVPSRSRIAAWITERELHGDG